MTGGHRWKAHASAFTFAVALVATAPRCAYAQGPVASANGSVVVGEGVGAGIAFDMLHQALSAIFLSGRPGETVSLFLPDGRATSGKAANARRGGAGGIDANRVVVLSTTAYRFDLPRPGGTGPDRGTGQDLMLLAQFN